MWPTALQFVDDTRTDPEENLAVDKELMRAVDAKPQVGWLRVWEQSTYAVIAGRSNTIVQEVDETACERDSVPILKRCSGGGAVLLGPGCLCYSLILPLTEEHRSLGVTKVTADIMQRLARAFSRPNAVIAVQGVSDLVLDGRKFSGNSQRWLKRSLLHHGTVLYDFNLDRIGRYLKFPSRVPEYRARRQHWEFVRNIDLPREDLIARLRAVWRAEVAQG